MNQESKKRAEIISSIIKQGEKDRQEIKKISESFHKAWTGFIETSRSIEENEKQKLVNYYNTLQKQLGSMSIRAGLSHLKSEKSKFEQLLIKAEIEKDGYTKKHYSGALQKIIIPMIKIWQEKKKNNLR